MKKLLLFSLLCGSTVIFSMEELAMKERDIENAIFLHIVLPDKTVIRYKNDLPTLYFVKNNYTFNECYGNFASYEAPHDDVKERYNNFLQTVEGKELIQKQELQSAQYRVDIINRTNNFNKEMNKRLKDFRDSNKN